MARGPSRSILSIQVLRAVAALGVVAWHLATELNTNGTSAPSLYIGQAGVDLFFVISGFVMVYSSERLFGAPGAPLTFMLSRIIRIAPLYWAISAVLLVHALVRHADLATIDLSAGSLLASFLFVPYPRPGGEFTPLLKVGWTLNYEMFFYAVFAAALVLRRNFAILAISAILTGIALASALAWPNVPTVFVWPDRIVAEFVFGILIGFARYHGVRLSLPAATCAVSAGVVLIAGLYGIGVTTPRAIAWGIPMALIVAGAALCRMEMTSPFWRAAGRLGDASYAMYLTHLFMDVPRLVAQRMFGMTDGPWIWWPIGYAVFIVIGVIVLALAVHRFFEVPVTRALRSRIGAQFSRKSPA
jgi:exopolysaccharide production protein ExoZ